MNRPEKHEIRKCVCGEPFCVMDSYEQQVKEWGTYCSEACELDATASDPMDEQGPTMVPWQEGKVRLTV